MKHSFLVVVITFFFCFLPGCKAENKAGDSSSSPKETFDRDASYALGMNIGMSLKGDRLYPNMEDFMQGIKDVLDDSQTRFTIEEAYEIFSDAFGSFSEEREVENRQVEIDFLAENSTKQGINVTGSGLQYEVITEGNGPKPTASDTVRVHYEGALTDGRIFDSSYSRGEPTEFSLSDVIPGWAEGLQLMNTGAAYRFYIPSDLGYGSYGAGGQIPPYATLVFKVELIDIVR